MARAFETGHAKNVANLDEIISFAKSLNGSYNPSKPGLKIDTLESLSQNCKAAMDAVKAASAKYSNEVDAREEAFESLNKLIPRISGAIRASETTKRTDETVMSLIRKLQGRRASPKRNDEQKKADAETGVEIREISASQMSYDNRIDNFNKLLELLISIPSYSPNETDLQPASLKILSDKLKAANSSVVTAFTILTNARIARNNLMYKPITGLVDIAMDTKSYIKSVFGHSSPQFKKVAGLEFRKA